MDVTQRRRKPAFEAESEAYTFFQRGTELLAAGHPAQAALLLSKALRREPARNSIREALGRAEFALGRHATAARLFAEIVADVPVNDYAHYALARCLLELGHGDEARGHLRTARALRPQSDLYRTPVEGID